MQGQEPFKLETVSVRLVKDAPLFSCHKVKTPADAVKLVGDFLCEMDREVVCVINLKPDGTPINCSIVSIGAVNQAMAEPRELFKASILSNSADMVMVHNHPSGSLEPSKMDTMITDRMLILAGLMGITLHDHVIVGGDNTQYFSFREKGLVQYQCMDSYLSTDYKTLDFEKTAIVAERGKAR